MSSKTEPLHEGLHFMSFDLHVHTPGSRDFQDRQATAAEIVENAVRSSLDAICITDHNTADWVDTVSEAAKGSTLSIFPGVEISVTGGKEGPIHIIGIFEIGTSAEEISDLLSRVGLTKAKRGDLNELAQGDPGTVIDEIASQRGIPILAHVDSSHGVLHDMRGQPRIKVVQNLNVQAAEASKPDYIKYLDGTDPDYRRFLPTYEASDAHSLKAIGSKRTYFKVSYPSLEAIRQCFLDPEVRVCLPDIYSKRIAGSYPRILSVSIDQGFFQGTCVALHPCQNCLIGGQGVGKSLIVELIRFGLNQRSRNEQIKIDSDSKLRQRLGVGGSVQIEFQLENGTKYKSSRTYDGSIDPIEVLNLDSGKAYQGEMEALFPIVAYSQTEAVEISRNQNAQLELIDGLIDAAALQDDIRKTQQTLAKNDTKLSQLMNAQTAIKETTKDISTKAEAIGNIDKALKNPILTSMKDAEDVKSALEEHGSYPDELSEALSGWLSELSDSYSSPTPTAKVSDAKTLADAAKISDAAYKAVEEALLQAKQSLRSFKASQKKLLSEWAPQYNAILRKYERFLRTQGGDIKGLAAKRRRLAEDKQELEKQLKSYQLQAKQLDEVMKERKRMLDTLAQVQSSLFETRRVKYEELTNLSQGKLRVSIERGADTSAFATALGTISTGTHIRKVDLTRIAQSLSPKDFIDYVLAEDYESIAEQAEIEEETAEKLTNWLVSLEARDHVLELQHAFLPQDKPLIEFKKDDDQYYPISDISVGQKCTALLMIALATGRDPIIIDQPEESIDIASVFSDVVSKLRSNKFERQFLLTTHNPNIAVTADSDLIHVLKASATKGIVDRTGGIDEELVKNEVINHLEGGRAPYLLRGRMYGLVSNAEPPLNSKDAT